MNLRNYPIINEDDDEHIITSTGLDSIKKPSAPKSDHQILQMYKRMINDDTSDLPLPSVWQELNGEKPPPSESTSPVLLVKQTKEGREEKNKNRQKSFELSSLNLNLPENEQKRLMAGKKNTTNYSEGYKETKPFSLKKEVRTNTVYHQEASVIPPSPEGVTAKQSTTDNFVKRLHNNIVKDKIEPKQRTPSTRTPHNSKQQQKLLKQQLHHLNNEQLNLQEQIRQYHIEWKSYCREVYQKYQIEYNKQEIQSDKEILTLEPPHRNSKQLSRKMEVIEEYKLYTDRIEVEIRKCDYLVGVKRGVMREVEGRIEKGKLWELLKEPIDEKEEDGEEEGKRPVVEGPTYREIMRARKNRDFGKLNKLIVADKQQETSGTNEQKQLPRGKLKQKEKINVYQSQQGQIKVNEHLRNLLLK